MRYRWIGFFEARRQRGRLRWRSVATKLVLLMPVVLMMQAKSTSAADDRPTATADLTSTADIYAKDEVDVAVDRAIAYLVSQQKPNGAIYDRGHETAMTSLAIMAMASVGTLPSDPTPDGRAINRALDFILKDERIDGEGYFGRSDGSRMYGHGITTLMLTEMLGMGTSVEQDTLIHERCQQGIDLILSSQRVKKAPHNRGGWRYNPNSNDSDLSVTVWQLMALRSAKNDGLQVPATAIRDAVEYLKRSYTAPIDPDGDAPAKPAGFSYEPRHRNASYTMTAAGLLAMQVCGEYDSPLVAGAATWLTDHPPKWTERWCSYGTYYYAQGMYQRGGEFANTADRLVREMLLKEQSDDGSWRSKNGSEQGHGKVYCTALSVLSLSVKYHYLPIYQK